MNDLSRFLNKRLLDTPPLVSREEARAGLPDFSAILCSLEREIARGFDVPADLLQVPGPEPSRGMSPVRRQAPIAPPPAALDDRAMIIVDAIAKLLGPEEPENI